MSFRMFSCFCQLSIGKMLCTQAFALNKWQGKINAIKITSMNMLVHNCVRTRSKLTHGWKLGVIKTRISQLTQNRLIMPARISTRILLSSNVQFTTSWCFKKSTMPHRLESVDLLKRIFVIACFLLCNEIP